MFVIITGVAMTIVKFLRTCQYWKPIRLSMLCPYQSQLEHVEIAFALALVLRGLISAGYNQGSGSHVAPKKAIYVKRPTAAPFAGAVLAGLMSCGSKQANTSTIDRH
jgi:peptidoglycan/LPS O-acetylase OafA/YrhL